MAKDNGWVAADPFKQQKLHLDKVDRGYLTIEEVSRLYNKEFESLRLEQVRDIFIFSCYTGLAYIDVYNLTEDQLNVWADGNTWISFHRQKTKVPFNVRLLDVPLQIIEKYKHFRKGKRLLPVPSNQKCNEYLKEIAEVCGINKNITFHLARHTLVTAHCQLIYHTKEQPRTDTHTAIILIKRYGEHRSLIVEMTVAIEDSTPYSTDNNTSCLRHKTYVSIHFAETVDISRQLWCINYILRRSGNALGNIYCQI